MVSFFGTQAEGLFLLVPFEVALHDDNTSVLDDVDEHSLI